jgi:hypothetical protein
MHWIASRSCVSPEQAFVTTLRYYRRGSIPWGSNYNVWRNFKEPPTIPLIPESRSYTLINSVSTHSTMQLSLFSLTHCTGFSGAKFDAGRSTCPRGLRHERSSPARTLGSCVRIPFKAWMSAFILFVLLCV